MSTNTNPIEFYTSYPIIPRPAKLEPQAGTFPLDAKTVICADEANRANAKYLQHLLHPPTGLPLPIEVLEAGRKNAIHLASSEKDAHLGREGYQLV
jgi:hypothetical protein